MQRCRISILLILVVYLLLATTGQAAVHEKVLYRFVGGTDGAHPSSSLLLDAAGNLYGTTVDGGNLPNCFSGLGCGVVFKLTPPSGNGKWKETVLYAFQGGTDGLEPTGGLVFDNAGNLYGTTYGGGTGTACTYVPGCGTVFELSPKGGHWIEKVLYSFQNGTDGALPSGLTIDASGNLYGTTIAGGAAGRGTVYELSPPQHKRGQWAETTLYAFQDFEIQANPGLVFDPKGNLYGTWYQLYSCYPGCGAVFELKHAGKYWQETDLYDFRGGGNGGEPMAGIVFDDKGHVYGTGAEGGNNQGIAFEVTCSGNQWTEVILYTFCSQNNCADGADPYAPLIFDQSGNLYGTTVGGGTGCSFNSSCGVVFKLTPGKFGWTETVLHNFKGSPDGSNPTQGVIFDKSGNIYGTTPNGGASGGYGTVFELAP